LDDSDFERSKTKRRCGMENWMERATEFRELILASLTGPLFYAQLAIAGTGFVLAFVLAAALRSQIKPASLGPGDGPASSINAVLIKSRELIFPLLAILLLGIAVQVSTELVGRSFYVRIGQGLAVVLLLYLLIVHFIGDRMIGKLMRWIGVPVALLYVFGWLDELTTYLETIALEVGNINLSAYDLLRTLFFGAILFWLGRVSNATGKQVIRSQPAFDMGTRELIAKLFEIFVFFLIFILMLQIIGINLTALTVFGGALGVGLGFGLQQIAANFISGIIILMDRSVTIGDFIELEDGRGGTIREMNMRCTTLETYDGKDIIVPNEQFIVSVFTNWTHNNKKQRYAIEFSVAYKTDLEPMFDIIRKVCSSHPQVLSGESVPIEERPDAEIASFGDSGINILVEFWMEGIDDGKNRVGADLLLMIWVALKENGIEIPFPQREVKLLPSGETASSCSQK
jgi:small-conductance mechanosensitive channel